MAEFYNVAWLRQNIAPDMEKDKILDILTRAPVVEIDTDLLHDIETKRGRASNKIRWAASEAVKISEEIGRPEMMREFFRELLNYGEAAW